MQLHSKSSNGFDYGGACYQFETRSPPTKLSQTAGKGSDDLPSVAITCRHHLPPVIDNPPVTVRIKKNRQSSKNVYTVKIYTLAYILFHIFMVEFLAKNQTSATQEEI
ncbi:hypothetical protein MO867_03155 [Microbulbifer sp. OS29]|uniref:Uncharacterized protein n=1 Tax=Microbulbifer okhotskensis TaxID=2926617 RepID=A0A9X2J591_9GAMM|nr:hypothetical protein [Microbulbifer okhotskensis]MCO1333330.1 hypothetical protein [Microbulbifer okhotskensis]